MRHAFIGSILLASAVSALAQGTIFFNNHIPGQVSAPFYGVEMGEDGSPLFNVAKTGNTSSGYPPGTQVYTGARLAGSNYRAQLLAAPGTQLDDALMPVGPATTFRTGSAAGFIVPVTVTLDNVPADVPVATFQVAIWDNSSQMYGNWIQAKAAWQSGLIVAALSPLYISPTTGATTFVQSFNLSFVRIPEPSAVGLIGLGGLWLVAHRRKK